MRTHDLSYILYPPIGERAQEIGHAGRLSVCKTSEGYFIGTHDRHGNVVTRESMETFVTINEAAGAFVTGDWTQAEGILSC